MSATQQLVLAYVRVSTDEQGESGAGLAAQRAAILAEAERRGWTEVEIVEDVGFSAKDLRRPGLAYALDRLRCGEADVLVVSKMDRLSRSLIDFASIMQRAQREGWALVALDSPADLTTPQGEAMAGVQAVFAQLERRLIGERTREALAQRRAAGVTLGRPRTLADEVVKRIRRMREDGMSLRAIAAKLDADGVSTAHGGRQWHASTVRAVLRSTG
jgi:DNA invertase Pin-like site-specific DNA recombinase